MGVARPRAQGHATTSTSTASLTLSASAPPGVAATTSGNRADPADGRRYSGSHNKVFAFEAVPDAAQQGRAASLSHG